MTAECNSLRAERDRARRWVEELRAERDRLLALNERLVKALKRLRPMCGAPHDYTIADVWQAQQEADDVLDEARKP